MAELTVLVPIGDRQVEMRKPSDGSMVVMARSFRTLPKIENVAEMTDDQRDAVVRSLGTLGLVVEQMIVNEADKDWLDLAMIDGSVSAEDLFVAVRVSGEKFNSGGGGSTPAKKTAAVRRRR